jgi:hypothetical protein
LEICGKVYGLLTGYRPIREGLRVHNRLLEMELHTGGINGWSDGNDGRESCQKVFGIMVILQEGKGG